MLAGARPYLSAATGSACTSGITEPSHVLTAIGLDSAAATQSIRFSIGRFSKLEEMHEAAAILKSAVDQLENEFEDTQSPLANAH